MADVSDGNTGRPTLARFAPVLAAGILMLLTPGAASAAKQCSDLRGSGARAASDIEAQGLSCKQAKKVAREFTNDSAIGGPVKRIDAAGYTFRCRTKRIAFETFRTKCTATTGGPRRGSFTWGF